MARAVTVDVDRANRGGGGVTEHSPDKSGSMVSLKVSLHIRGLLRVFTPPETLHENALFALIDL